MNVVSLLTINIATQVAHLPAWTPTMPMLEGYILSDELLIVFE